MRKPAIISKLIIFLAFIAFLIAGIQTTRAAEAQTQIVGWVEYITILPEKMKIKAKLDTGARNSSLNAVNIVEFKRKGQTFVRFDLTNWKGRRQTTEARVIREAKIKQHDSKPEFRPVIRLGLCLGSAFRKVEVNLVNRSNFNYQMLVGRSFLKGLFAVDAARTFTINTDCKKVAVDE